MRHGQLLGQRIVQGLGAGLVAGAAVGMAEVLVLVVMEMTWQHVEGLLYSVIVYGGLGLLGGLGLGLLRGLWQATIPEQDAEPSADRSTWAAYGAALLFGLGLFLVVRNRVRHDVLHMIGLPWSWETLLLDGALFVVVGLGTAVMLWLLLRRLLRGGRAARIAQPRWNLAA